MGEGGAVRYRTEPVDHDGALGLEYRGERGGGVGGVTRVGGWGRHRV